MFSVFCPTHDARILLTRRNALDFWNGPDGPVIRWRCNCGHEGILTRDGSVADPTPAAEHTTPDRVGIVTDAARIAH